jgi:glycopeptide antibiotics resistance protein
MGIKTPRTIALFTGLTPKSRVLYFVLLVLSIAPLLPLSNFAGHPHWDLIRWIPFQDFSLSRNMLKDVIGNILWFMVFGYLLRYQLKNDSRTPWIIATIIAVAGGVSFLIEFFQVFCHNRIPAMTDVVCDVLGAGLGGYFATKQRAPTATEPWPATWLSNVMGHKEVTGSNTLQQIHAPLQARPPAGFE